MKTHYPAPIPLKQPPIVTGLPKQIFEEPADLLYRIAALTATLFVVATLF